MYFAPYIDSTGVHLPTYQDRLDALIASYQSIFGPEVNLEISSPDYQLLSLFARSLDDLSQLILADFAARNPQYATGAGLDLLLPLMGLTRAGATHSTVPLTLTGTPGATLSSAPRVLDDAGYIWACQVSGIKLDSSGSATVSAICETAGAISAPVGSVHRLVSPVSGLASVINQTAATMGKDAETDASCRNRLRLAAAAPAVSTMDALRSAVRSVSGVTSCVVYENNTDATDSRGIPAHSLCVAVSGGATNSIAPVVFAKKAPGIGTYGSVEVTVTDDFGAAHKVCFQRVQPTAVALTIELKKLSGFDSSVTDLIKAALTEYSSSLEIGQDVVVPSLYAIVYEAAPSFPPTFSISLLTATAKGVTTGDVLSCDWNQRYTFPAGMIQIILKD